jgi:hypothetical protein
MNYKSSFSFLVEELRNPQNFPAIINNIDDFKHYCFLHPW